MLVDAPGVGGFYIGYSSPGVCVLTSSLFSLFRNGTHAQRHQGASGSSRQRQNGSTFYSQAHGRQITPQ